jgi:cation diffusion facilitator CzcD-associated flavoprotein CzcO
MTTNGEERCHTLVIGGGQAGLPVGYHRRRRGVAFVILGTQRRAATSHSPLSCVTTPSGPA